MKAALIGVAAIAFGAVIWAKQYSPLNPVENLPLCGQYQQNTNSKTCIVDGDTLWLSGANIRFKGFGTPECPEVPSQKGSHVPISAAHLTA